MLDQPEMPPTAAAGEASVLPPAVVAYVERHTRAYPGGHAYAVDESGYVRFHSDREGCPEWTPADLAQWTRRSRPELWTVQVND